MSVEDYEKNIKKCYCKYCRHLVTIGEVKLALGDYINNGYNIMDCPHCAETISVWMQISMVLKEVGT